MCKDPRLFVDGISTRDLHQGSLGNCWMVAATSCLATEPSLWKKVIPDHMEQEWNPKRPYLYAGIFHFRFWRFGQWMDVVVDDRLPVSADGPCFLSSAPPPGRFGGCWRKLLPICVRAGSVLPLFLPICNGPYLIILSPPPTTGGMPYAPPDSTKPTSSQSSNVQNNSSNFQKSLPDIALRGDRKEERLSKRQLHERRDHTEKKKKAKVKQKPGPMQKANEDEFQAEEKGVVNESWEREMDRRSRCGGCINHKETFLRNPQFMFELGGEGDEVLICLQQEDRRIKRREGGGENLPIGFEVLRVEVNRVNRVQCFTEQAASSVYMDSRSITLRVTLEPGRYALLPTTFQPGVTGRFLLRLFSHTRVKLRELKEELPFCSLWQCCVPQPCAVVTVHLHRASTLSQPKHPAPDVYAVIKCEENTIKTRVFKKDRSPEFNTKAIFYRRNPQRKICIEIWGRGLLFDSFLGRAYFQTGASERGRTRVIELQGGHPRSCIYVETSTSQCLTDL
ncbi:Calpain-6 [Bagarius yarrelli]|uniref:Calpain-6 n=1 Tax=Bagarius yarrelli TaxID=175774 RepID=A0A556TZ23_BAGYA|nr:Calpain-6 [Bagarius yarrelli]